MLNFLHDDEADDDDNDTKATVKPRSFLGNQPSK